MKNINTNCIICASKKHIHRNNSKLDYTASRNPRGGAMSGILNNLIPIEKKLKLSGQEAWILGGFSVPQRLKRSGRELKGIFSRRAT